MLSLPASWSTNSRTGSTGRGSEFLRPARYRVLPHSLPVLLEDELGVRWRGEPDALRQLALELPGSPAGVAECHQALFRASVHGDVAQDLAARRHRQLGVDRHGIGTAIFGAMDHEAAIGLDWTAGEKAHVPYCPIRLLAERLEQRRERALLQGAIDDDAHGTAAIVPHEHDDGLIEARVAHAGRSNQ